MCLILGVFISVLFIIFNPVMGFPQETRERSPLAGVVWQGMRLTGSVEPGFRILSLSGKEAVYQSHINLDEGPRLFGLNLEGVATDRSYRFIDSFRLQTSAIGGEPQESVTLMVRKLGLYRFDARFWQSDYFFNFPSFALGQHTYDARRRMLNLSLQVTPPHLRVNAGYSRSNVERRYYSTLFTARDEFWITAPLDRTVDDLRVSLGTSLAGIDFDLEQSVRFYENRQNAELTPGANAGNNPDNRSRLDRFSRTVQEQETIPVTRISVHTHRGRKLDLVGRYLYSKGALDYTREGTSAGFDLGGNPVEYHQLDPDGHSDRPSHLAQFGATYALTRRLTVNELARLQRYKITGYTTQENRSLISGVPINADVTYETETALTSLQNSVNVEYLLNQRLTLRAGYRYSFREVSFTSQITGGVEQTTLTTHTFSGGLGYRLGNRLIVFGEYRKGEQDNAFTRISAVDFSEMRIRLRYRPTVHFFLSSAVVFRDTNNPNPATENIVDTHSYAVSVGYTPASWLTASVGYNLLNLDSRTDIIFFVATQRQKGVSQYTLDDHIVSLTLTATGTRVKGMLTYHLADTSGSFPVRYQYLRPRVSLKLMKSLWLNGAYFHYRYNQQDDDDQDYHVHGMNVSLTMGL